MGSSLSLQAKLSGRSASPALAVSLCGMVVQYPRCRGVTVVQVVNVDAGLAADGIKITATPRIDGSGMTRSSKTIQI